MNNQKKIIALAGNKGVGKTTLANEIRNKNPNKNIKILSLAYPLKSISAKVASSIFSSDYSEFFNVFNSSLKEEPIFNDDKTPREFLIDFSENLLKKYFGEDVWVNMLIDTIEKSNSDYFIIDDIRFELEVSALRKQYSSNFLVMKVDGESCYNESDFNLPLSCADMDCLKINDKFVWKYDSSSKISETILEEI